MSGNGAPPPPDASLVGQVLGNFKIVSLLGTGGMGVVYAAEHTLIGKKAAVKVLLPKFSANSDIVQRFFNEARTAATLQHPGIIDVFDFGKLPTGEAYLVMDFLQGESLTRRLQRDGVVALPQLVAIARQIAAAVGAAHGKNIVHRDLKPDNVYLEPDAAMPFGVRVKVIDFGIAKLADEGKPGEVQTQAGELLGTPFYMSPEQCRGAGDVDGRSDIYALGCIVYQMAVGTVPFEVKGTGALIAAHIYEEPPPPRTIDANLSPALERVILRALAKEPAARQQSMDELIAELDAAAAAPIEAAPAPAPTPTLTPAPAPTPAPSTGGARRILLVSLASVLLGGLAIFLFASRGKSSSMPRLVAPLAADAAPAAVPPVVAAPSADAAPVTCDDGDLAACVAAADTIAAREPVQAAALYKKACDGGVVDGCVRLGLASERGRGVDRDLTRAFALYLQACDRKHADACALLASMYEDGKGVSTDTSKAIALYTRACDAGSGLGCTGIGTLTAMGQGLPADATRALAFFDRACAAGEPVGCLRAGRAHQRGVGAPADAAAANGIWAELDRSLPPRCAAGEARACNVLGIVRHLGLGRTRDSTGLNLVIQSCELGYARGCAEASALVSMTKDGEAFTRTLAERACEGGDDLGCALFGQLLVKAGEGERAVELLERACAGGGESGCDELARLYDAGGAIPEDKGRATALFRRACEGGSFAGCMGLGSRLGDGVGARKDERRARLAAEKACKIEPGACWMEARYLAQGIGGAADLERAKLLYARSCEAGDESSCAQAHALLEPDAGVAADAGAP